MMRRMTSSRCWGAAMLLGVITATVRAQDAGSSGAPPAASPPPAAPAVADPPGWRLGLAQSLGRDTNLLRLPAARDPQPDTAASTAVDVGLRASWGLQRALAYGQWERTRHSGSGVLDHTARRSGLVWDVETVGSWSGRLLVRRQRDLAPDDLRIDPLTGRRNEQRITQALAQLRWNARGPFGVEALHQRDEVSETAQWSLLRNFSQTTGSLGLQWRSHGGLGAGPPGAETGGWELGLARREVDGRQPASSLQPDESGPGLEVARPIDYRQQLWDFQGRTTWPLRGGLSWRYGHGRGERAIGVAPGSSLEPQDPIRSTQDLRSLMIEGRWRWGETLNAVGRAVRDQGQQSRVLEPLTATANLGALSALESTDLRGELHWSPGPRWSAYVLMGRTARRWQELVAVQVGGATAGLLPGTQWEDSTRRHRLGLRWTLGPAWSLRCQLGLDRRGAARGIDPSGAPRSVEGGGWQSRSVECGLRWDSATVATPWSL